MDSDELAFAGIAQQAKLLDQRELTPRELVEAYLARIERIDPALNSFRVVLGEQALDEAKRAGRRTRAREGRPLYGVPIAVKDTVNVAGQVRGMGVDALGAPAAEDDEVIRRLREAGAIVIGITQVPQLAVFPFTETLTFGATRNPWNLAHTPGGSSGGSAAAVAAGLAAAALGSDGAGSIRIPAACCGIFGLKPQRGRVSLQPDVEHWHGLSVVGPLARRVEDAALLLDAVAGAAPGDRDVPPPPSEPFAEAARRRPERLRIALSFKFAPGLTALAARLAPEVRRATEETAELLRSLGHHVVPADPKYGTVVNDVSARYLRGIHDDAAQVQPQSRLERRIRAYARLGGLITPGMLARGRATEQAASARIGEIFADHDVLLTPTLTTLPPEVGHWAGRSLPLTLLGTGAFAAYTAPWNALGWPAASVPAGVADNGLPLAVQLVGRPNDEATLLSLAGQIEAERPWADRRPSLPA
ncbi:MAG TPA: amidase [Solirubrobacteraceae bacterium]|nr:amidase [Solirubrobacteraceae bacterium]